MNIISLWRTTGSKVLLLLEKLSGLGERMKPLCRLLALNTWPKAPCITTRIMFINNIYLLWKNKDHFKLDWVHLSISGGGCSVLTIFLECHTRIKMHRQGQQVHIFIPSNDPLLNTSWGLWQDPTPSDLFSMTVTDKGAATLKLSKIRWKRTNLKHRHSGIDHKWHHDGSHRSSGTCISKISHNLSHFLTTKISCFLCQINHS